MTDRPTPHPASDRALAGVIVAVGVCGLHPGDWPSSALPSWLEPQVLFALLLCASSIARIARSAPQSDVRATRISLRRATRSAYLTIYLVIGIDQAVAWMHGDSGQPQNLQQLRWLVAWGIAATVLTRIWAGLRNAGVFALGAEPPRPLRPSTDDRS
jgi:hypothetical protein